ncbi:MAG: DUF92 domain-containing protein [Chitinophagaceae bacterium]|nr:DUF92 domain-containing protein [Chitinophagaceae bacterium]
MNLLNVLHFDAGYWEGWLGPVMLLVLFLAVYKRKLTPAAGFVAFLLGLTVLEGTGFAGAAMLIAFFVMGVLASAYKKKVKRSVRAGIPHSEERNMAQVLANGGITGMLAVLAIIDEAHKDLFVFLIAGSLASAAADTIASELGTVMGSRFVNVLDFRREERGLDGVVSLEGTLAGIIAAAVIALIHSAFMGFSADALLIVLAGATGNWIDSVLGATLQRKGRLDNDQVNAINTLTGAIVALVLKLIFG